MIEPLTVATQRLAEALRAENEALARLDLGAAERERRPMLLDAIARDMARADGPGIGDAVLRDLVRLRDRITRPRGEPT